MVADKPQGYFFGDTVLLTATFTSPDLPIYEARLTKMILGRNKVERTPNIGAATTVTRNVNTTLVDSAAGPAAVGALSTLAVNTNFTYLPTADPNVVEMKVTPNMLPKQAGVDFNDESFLTTDDFDSITVSSLRMRAALDRSLTHLLPPGLHLLRHLPHLLRPAVRLRPAPPPSPRP
ncbi:hypothetical protein DFJ74DRAFT_441274 [Hyaloraphidium curvatum]|nr:hypothetical protein DFJ74DRAFT_441274 [Hyaloraphidium curvatum]